MEALIVFMKTFLAGAGIGSVIALFIGIMKNRMALKNDPKLSMSEILMMVIIGFIIGGCLGQIYIK